jgi:phosphomevalonate kinase
MFTTRAHLENTISYWFLLFLQIEARGLPLTPEALLSLPPFSSITFNSEVANGTMTGEKCKPEVAKTGLGSSAAMTTSVVAALLHYLGVVSLSCPGQSSGDNTTRRELDLIHSIAQSAHCIAQGKIGSGFDVSAAVYGSQRYVRFSPEILSSQVRNLNGRWLAPHEFCQYISLHLKSW